MKTPSSGKVPLTLGDIKDRLRAFGLRATRARLQVVQALAGHTAPATHADLVRALTRGGLDRATVFRNLTDLTRVGLVSRRDLGDHAWRFELQWDFGDHAAAHPHFFCTQCNAVSCLPDVSVHIETGPNAPKSLRSRQLDVQLRGRCEKC